MRRVEFSVVENRQRTHQARVKYIVFDHANADFQLSSGKHENMMGEKFEPVLRTEIRKVKAP
jgi:hypothetical protein